MNIQPSNHFGNAQQRVDRVGSSPSAAHGQSPAGRTDSDYSEKSLRHPSNGDIALCQLKAPIELKKAQKIVSQLKKSSSNKLMKLAEKIDQGASIEKLDLGKLGKKKILLAIKAIRLRHTPGLQVLNLSYNKLGAKSTLTLIEALQSGHPSELKSLDLSFNKLGAKGALALSVALQSGRLPGLHSLNLSNNELGANGALALSAALQSGHLSGLQSLDLSGNYFDAEGARTLSAVLQLGHLPELQSLDLSDNRLGAEGARALSAALQSEHLSHLQSLDLKFNPLGAEGVRALSTALQSGRLPELKSLDLSYSNLGPDGAHALSEALQSGCLSGLQSLDLRNNNLGSDGALALSKALQSGRLSGLQSLNLKLNDLSSKSENTIAQAIISADLSKQLKIYGCDNVNSLITQAMKDLYGYNGFQNGIGHDNDRRQIISPMHHKMGWNAPTSSDSAELQSKSQSLGTDPLQNSDQTQHKDGSKDESGPSTQSMHEELEKLKKEVALLEEAIGSTSSSRRTKNISDRSDESSASASAHFEKTSAAANAVFEDIRNQKNIRQEGGFSAASSGINTEDEQHDHNSILIQAVKRNEDPKMFTSLIKRFSSKLNHIMINKKGTMSSALDAAVHYGRPELVDQLLQEDVPSAQNKLEYNLIREARVNKGKYDDEGHRTQSDKLEK